VVANEKGFTYARCNRTHIPALALGGYRAALPVKSFFTPAHEELTEPDRKLVKRIVVGIKNCDLLALPALDAIYNEPDFPDAYYANKRANTLIIATDCTAAGATCFCTQWSNEPYPGGNHDVAVSELPDGMLLVAAATEAGRQFIATGGLQATAATADQAARRDAQRRQVSAAVSAQNAAYTFGRNDLPAFEQKFDAKQWQEAAKPCVVCGGCTHVCPTCHCFFIRDHIGSTDFAREKHWDSCQYTGYGRVAGGGNPRPKIHERLRNRYYCKTVHRPERVKTLCCTGCGRCIAACQGKIDMRRVLTDVLAGDGK